MNASQNKCVKFEKKASNDYHAHIDKMHYLIRSKASYICEIFLESISMYIYLFICVKTNPNESTNMRQRLFKQSFTYHFLQQRFLRSNSSSIKHFEWLSSAFLYIGGKSDSFNIFFSQQCHQMIGTYYDTDLRLAVRPWVTSPSQDCQF